MLKQVMVTKSRDNDNYAYDRIRYDKLYTRRTKISGPRFRKVYSAATDLMGGGSFKPTFIRRYFLNLTVKKYENWFTFADVLPFGAGGMGVL